MNQQQDGVDVRLKVLFFDQSTQLAHRNEARASVFVVWRPNKLQYLLDRDFKVVTLAERQRESLVHGGNDLDTAFSDKRVS